MVAFVGFVCSLGVCLSGYQVSVCVPLFWIQFAGCGCLGIPFKCGCCPECGPGAVRVFVISESKPVHQPANQYNQPTDHGLMTGFPFVDWPCVRDQHSQHEAGAEMSLDRRSSWSRHRHVHSDRVSVPRSPRLSHQATTRHPRECRVAGFTIGGNGARLSFDAREGVRPNS